MSDQTKLVDVPATRSKTKVSFVGATELMLPTGKLKGQEVRFLVVARWVEEGDRETAQAGDVHFAKAKIRLLEAISADGKGPVKVDEKWLSNALADEDDEG